MVKKNQTVQWFIPDSPSFGENGGAFCILCGLNFKW